MKQGKKLVFAVLVGLALSIATLATSRTKYELRTCPSVLQSMCYYFVNVHSRGLPFSVISKIDRIKPDVNIDFPEPSQVEINNAEVESTSKEVSLKGAVMNWLIFSTVTLLIFILEKSFRKNKPLTKIRYERNSQTITKE